MSTVIKVENLSKQYRLGQIGTGTISHDLNRWWSRVIGKEDPFLKIGEANDRTQKGNSDYVWALQDINFEVKQGDVLGIVGRNGAGKSTLLKILSKTTAPTTGSIKVKGRIASLLEVGTGFHPELSGRDNIFLNGAILGMSKKEIKSKFDEIVDFSGVERYIDTPVKRYSSGMYVRLAFAVAAHLEPEILIVDEVLAVGDLEFQKKCLGKMNSVSKNEGRTILFVSHNLGMINALCNSGLVLSNGRTVFEGSVFDSTDYYISKLLRDPNNNKTSVNYDVNDSLKAQILKCTLFNEKGIQASKFDVFDKPYLEIEYVIREPIKSMNLCWVLNRNGDVFALSFDTDFNEELLEERIPGKYLVKTMLPFPLKAGSYVIESLSMGIANVGAFNVLNDVLAFDVNDYSFDPTYKSFSSNRNGVIPVTEKWIQEKI